MYFFQSGLSHVVTKAVHLGSNHKNVPRMSRRGNRLLSALLYTFKESSKTGKYAEKLGTVTVTWLRRAKYSKDIQ